MNRFITVIVTLLLLSPLSSAWGQKKSQKPVNPDASTEARALLDYFYSISGKYILSGQHNYPAVEDRNTVFAKEYIGQTPLVFSTDWGFSADGDKDSYLSRPAIVREAIRQHRKGSIITICWHAVPPTADEPVTFQPVPGNNPDSIASVQGKLTDRQFRELLTPGTPIYKHWCSQVDTIARYLIMLQDAHVPVLWRPYHEMNGSWFWWGGRYNGPGTAALYRQLFDRLTKVHKLNNLVWVWSVDRPYNEAMKYDHYYPGNEYLDILALDVYGNDFNQDYYDKLLALSMGKPIVLGEVGNPPSPEILRNQPEWAYFVTWAGMVRNIGRKQYAELKAFDKVLFLESRDYRETVSAYRKKCNLPELSGSDKSVPGFSGKWVLDEDASDFGNAGPSQFPNELIIRQKDKEFMVSKVLITEYDENLVITHNFTADGQEVKEVSGSFPATVRSEFTGENNNDLRITVTTVFIREESRNEVINTEVWKLTDNDQTLTTFVTTKNNRGEKSNRLVYKRINLL